MPFSNSIVGGGGNLVRDSVQSPDFLDGVTGWQIRKDGTATFRNVTIGSVGHGVVINPDEILIYDEDGNLDGRLASSPGSKGGSIWFEDIRVSSMAGIRKSGTSGGVAMWGESTNPLDDWKSSISLANHFYLLAEAEPNMIQYIYTDMILQTMTFYVQHSNGNGSYLDLLPTGELQLNAQQNSQPGVRLERLSPQRRGLFYLTSATNAEVAFRLDSAGDTSYVYFSNNGRIRTIDASGTTRNLPFATWTIRQSVTPVANTVQSMYIAFPADRFTSVPRVTIGINTTTPQSTFAGINNVTTAGFDLYYYRTTNGSFIVNIHAIQEAP